MTSQHTTPTCTSSTKRFLSNSSTPSPTVRKPQKTIKLESSDLHYTNLHKSTMEDMNPDELVHMLGMTEQQLLQMDNDGDKISVLVSAFKRCELEMSNLRKENAELKNKVSTVMGKSIQLENELEKSKNKIAELEWRQMRQNLVLYNVEEREQENTMDLIPNVLTETLKIPKELISTGESKKLVDVDVAHRIGKKVSGKPRPIVVRFTSMKGKEIVQDFGRKKKGLKIKIADQYPSQMKEKRSAQIETLKNYREMHKDTGTRVKLIKDKLYVGQHVVDDLFEKNKLQLAPTDEVGSIQQVTHTTIQEINKSYFQGHASKVHSLKQAAALKQSLFQSPHIAHSDHVTYAYTVTDENGMTIQGNSDDGEWSASRLLVDLIKEKGLSNIFLAVSRQHKGPNLGHKRFHIISSIATEALQNLGS